jgi:hypothetical protein
MIYTYPPQPQMQGGMLPPLNTREDIAAYLASPAGNSLPPSAWNDLAQRQGSAPSANAPTGLQPWQAGYINPNPGGLNPYEAHALMFANPGLYADAVANGRVPSATGAPAPVQQAIRLQTGQGEGQEVPYSSADVNYAAQRYFTAPHPPSQAFLNSFPGFQQDESAIRTIPQNQQQPWSMQAAYQNASTDPRLAALSGLQRRAVLTAASGYDPMDYQQQQTANIKAAVSVQQDYLQQQNEIAKSAGSTPDAILGSAGYRNLIRDKDTGLLRAAQPGETPDAPNYLSHWIEPKYSPGEMGLPGKQTPGHFEGITLQDLHAIQSLANRNLQTGDQPYSLPQNATAALQAKAADLIQKAALPASARPETAHMTDPSQSTLTAGAAQVQPPVDAFQRGAQTRAAIGNALGGVFNNSGSLIGTAADRTGQNVGGAVANTLGFLGLDLNPNASVGSSVPAPMALQPALRSGLPLPQTDPQFWNALQLNSQRQNLRQILGR